jgi:serine protease Do
MRVGERVPLLVQRGSRQMNIDIVVADLPDANSTRVEVFRDLQVITLTSAIRGDRNIASPSGAVVVAVSQQITRAAGLLQGDVILQVNSRAVRSAEDLRNAINELRRPARVTLLLERNRRQGFVEFVIR